MADRADRADRAAMAATTGTSVVLDTLETIGPRLARAGRAPLLAIEVGSESFVVASEGVVGIERTDRLQRNPAGGEIAGWLLGGDGGRRAEEDIPVFSLAVRLGLGDRPSDRARSATRGAILRLQSEGGAGRVSAVLVDGLGRANFGVEHRRPIPAALGRYGSLFRGALVAGDRIELELDIATLGVSSVDAAGLRPAVSEAPLPAADGLPLLRSRGTVSRGIVFSALGGDGRSIEGERFALSAAQVLEVTGDLAIRKVPGAEPPLVGLVAWRDRAVPVFDLGPGSSFGGSPRLLVARTRQRAVGGGVVALVVASDIRFENLRSLAGAEPSRGTETISPTLDHRSSVARLGSFMIEGGSLSVPDLDLLLLAVSNR